MKDSKTPSIVTPASIPPGAQAPRGTILALEPDRVSARFIEMSLGAHGLSVEVARDGAAAFEVLRQTPVDLIFTETSLPDMTGQQFMRRIAEDSWYSHIPVVFLSAESRVASRVAAFRAGATDYLTKPVDKTELAARCFAMLHRHEKARQAARRRPYSLAGDFTAIPFADLVVMLQMGRRTGTLSVVGKQFSGHLAFDDGNLIHAACGNIVGNDAFYRMLADPEGRFELDPTKPEIPEGKRTVTGSVTGLLMEGARIHDEAARDSSVRSAPVVPLMPDVATLASSVRVLAGLPTAGTGALFEEGLSDPFTLGELQLWSPGELHQWTATASSERLHVLLIADLTQGTAAMLSLASSPSQRFVYKSLGHDPKILGLTFFLKRDAEVDVILLDVKSAATHRESLRQLPSVVIVAPPEGDLLAAGVRGRADLELLLEKLMPPSLIGVGNPSLGQALGELPAVTKGICKLKTITGNLGEGTAELRSVLLEGARLWDSQGKDGYGT